FMARKAPGEGSFAPVESGKTVTPAFKDDETAQSFYVDTVRRMDEYIAQKYPDLESRSVVATGDSVEKMIITSDAGSGHTILPRGYMYITFTVKGPDSEPIQAHTILGGSGSFEERFAQLDFVKAAADELYETVRRKSEGVYADAGEKICVLSGTLAGMLAHEAVGHTLEADLVLAGSVAGPNFGKMVASPLVSMTDFAHTAFGSEAPLPVFMDDEGTLAQDAPLIVDGRLAGYMHDRASANRLKMKALGNARAWSYSDEPLIRMRNTAIHPGASSLEEMIASVDDGYYLVDTNNGQADTTGEFMFGVTVGYEIKNGKLGRAIRDTTISGVAFDMLKTVDMVGNTVQWSSSGYCGKKQPMPVGLGGPAIRCKVMVGGR
ncbi:MAG: TldD/PmbA family protein, partial [Oscillospiraceae bacterium]|nr:TldD/PmbA family protein [Oscillospiraceae bacterium]